MEFNTPIQIDMGGYAARHHEALPTIEAVSEACLVCAYELIQLHQPVTAS